MSEKKGWKILYLIVVFLICLLPSVGLLVKQPQQLDAEKRALAHVPALKTEEGWNVNWLSQAGDYFQEHFAFRNELVHLNAVLMSRTFGVSSDDGVIDGTDGWLYYADSLDDYLGKNLLDERSLFNIARTMKQMQQYVQAQGKTFLYLPVPNKNTLYGEQMPYYYQYKASEERNLERLYELLEEQEVSYLNLQKALEAQEEILYHKTDSHWTNQGAALAADWVMEALGRTPLGISKQPTQIRSDFTGDLQEMLYPLSQKKEEEVYYEYDFQYEYVNEISSTFDPKIQTYKPGGQGSLIMYRDSFGNALLPFVAEGFQHAYFSRSVPYPLTDLDLYPSDTVIVERAERFLPDTAQNPPVMAGQKLVGLPEDARQLDVQSYPEQKWTEDGLYLRLDGVLDETCCTEQSRIYVKINGADIYEALPVTVKEEDGKQNSYGYRLYLPKLEGAEYNAEIYVSEQNAAILLEQTEEMQTEEFIDLSILEAAG